MVTSVVGVTFFLPLFILTMKVMRTATVKFKSKAQAAVLSVGRCADC